MSAAPSLFLSRPSGLQRLHPLTKLSLVLVAVAGAATLSTTGQLLALYGLGLFPLAAWSRVGYPFLRASLRAIAPFVISLAIIQGFFYPGEQVLFSLGPFTYKLEGVGFGLQFSARLLIGLSSGLLLLFTTRMDHLMQALSQRGVSPRIAYISVTALQIIPRFQARGRSIVDAQRARGLRTEGSFWRRARSLWYLVPPLLFSSLMETDTRAIALEARGFSKDGPKTSWAALADSRTQRLLRRGCLLAALLLVAARLADRLVPP